jgi:undecaprenyl-diphosphatase
LYQVIVLAIVQGLAELLPVSSSAHVVVAEKLMGLDPSSPQMTLLLVMLHTGTMFAVIAYFWKQWKQTYFASADAFKRFAVRVVWATALTGRDRRGADQADRTHHVQRRSQGGDRRPVRAAGPGGAGAGCGGVLILIAGLREKKADGAAVRSG